MKKKQEPRSAALRYVYDRYIGNDPERIASVDEERINLDIACKIHDLRTKGGLSQRALAKRVGTSASAICRLEDGEYEGHSLSMLRRIAQALGQRVEVRFVPAKQKSVPA
jgi:DNA-binding XRE family transcriptional regulator